MKIYIFLSLFLAIFIVWILFFKPFDISQKSVNTTQIKFKDFHLVSLVPQGEEFDLKGKLAIKKDHLLIIDTPLLTKEDKLLQAKKGVYYENLKKIHLESDVKYFSPQYNFFAQNGDYFLKDSLLQVNSPFHLVSKNIEVNGSKLYYYEKSGKIIAYDIKAKIEREQ